MYKELDKYKTGKKIPKKVELTKGAVWEIETDEYEFKMGNLLNDFIEHKSKSFFKKKYYHDNLTDTYIKILNQITMTTNI